MKKAIACMFLSIVLLNVAGVYTILIEQLDKVYEEMQSKARSLPLAELDLLTLSSEQLASAFVDENEIEVAGHRYDVARIVPHNTKLLVYCLRDHYEENLLALLNDLLESDSTRCTSITTSVFFMLVVQASIELNIPTICFNRNILPSLFATACLREGILERIYLPPRVA